MLGRLEAALERERTFVDDASHELRTPLAMHKTELELALRYAKTPEEMRAAIASAIVEVDRLSALAEDLLVLARSEQGKLALHLRRVRLADLLGDVRERFASRIDGPDATLVVEPTERVDDRRRPASPRAGAHQSGRQRAPARRWRDHGAGQRVRPRSADPCGGPRARVPAGVPRPRLRALQPRRSGAWWRRHRTRPGDRGGDRPRPRGTAHAANRNGSGADVWIELPAQPR